MALNLPNKIQTKLAKSQQGSALMLAVFVIVIVLLLGITLVEILSTGDEAVSQEVLGTRALAAANSGMQGQLQVLFPLNNVAGSCPATTNYNFSNIDGLSQCSAVVTCDNYVNVEGISYYRLASTGSCGTGDMEADSRSIILSSRTVQVEARSL